MTLSLSERMMQVMINYDDIRYPVSVFFVWKALKDLSDKIPVVITENPTLIENQIVKWDSMRLIRLATDINSEKLSITPHEIINELNMQLQYVILPEQNILPQYVLDKDSHYGRMEALYVYEIKIFRNRMLLDVLIIDSPRALREAQSNEARRIKI